MTLFQEQALIIAILETLISQYQEHDMKRLEVVEEMRDRYHKERVQGAINLRGVHFNRARNKYTAQIKRDGKTRNLGNYNTPEEASEAYERAAHEYEESKRQPSEKEISEWLDKIEAGIPSVETGSH
jgi:AP2 domain